MKPASFAAAAAILVAAPLLSTSPGAGAVPGYYVDSSQARAPRPAAVEDTTGAYTISIRRDAQDADASRLLAVAESVYPPKDVLIGLAQEAGHDLGSDASHGPLWWCDGTGAARVPYSVTASAVQHYAGLTRRFREIAVRNPASRRVFSSKLEYRASVAFRNQVELPDSTFRDVYVAHLELSWSYDDGTYDTLTEARRLVLLTRGGEVLSVRGDGMALEEMQISTRMRGGAR